MRIPPLPRPAVHLGAIDVTAGFYGVVVFILHRAVYWRFVVAYECDIFTLRL
jgi:hypothetical protein